MLAPLELSFESHQLVVAGLDLLQLELQVGDSPELLEKTVQKHTHLLPAPKCFIMSGCCLARQAGFFLSTRSSKRPTRSYVLLIFARAASMFFSSIWVSLDVWGLESLQPCAACTAKKPPSEPPGSQQRVERLRKEQALGLLLLGNPSLPQTCATFQEAWGPQQPFRDQHENL